MFQIIPSENEQARLLAKQNGIQEGRRHLRLVFPLMLQEQATREADELSQIQIRTFVDFHFQYAFKNKPVVLIGRQFHSVARFSEKKNFKNDFF